MLQWVRKRNYLAVFALAFAANVSLSFAQKSAIQKPNVLFIIVDDLKPELGCYGYTTAKSPNIDALASTSTVFTKAYCQQAICGPTRASFLTGLRPDRTQVWDLKVKMRDMNADIVTLPYYFKQNGYYTIGMGKVFDPSNVDAAGDSISWSSNFKKTFPLAKGYENIVYGIYQNPESKKQAKETNSEGKEENEFFGKAQTNTTLKRYATECLDVPDDAYMDGAMANYAIEQLRNLKNSKQPFFMAVGFKKPHLPFIAPKKYWDLYDRNKIDLAAWQQKAINSPEIAYHNSGELRNYSADIKSLDEKPGSLLKLSDEKQRELIHGYYACVSYTDAQIGKLLATLKETGLDKNTIIVLLGDHGWHLGDHSLWCKHSNFEQAVNAPLIIKAPKITKGLKYNQPVEFVDVFPTICQLAGLKINKNLDGKSLVPILKNNNKTTTSFAVSQYPRASGGDYKKIMGYSIRTERYRYTEWIGNSFNAYSNEFNEKAVMAVELYDYKDDALETKNLVKEESKQIIVKELANKLHQYYQQQYSLSKNKK